MAKKKGSSKKSTGKKMVAGGMMHKGQMPIHPNGMPKGAGSMMK